jgi:hypothetical protein
MTNPRTPEDLSPEAYAIGKMYEALDPDQQRVIRCLVTLFRQRRAEGLSYDWVAEQLEADPDPDYWIAAAEVRKQFWLLKPSR